MGAHGMTQRVRVGVGQGTGSGSRSTGRALDAYGTHGGGWVACAPARLRPGRCCGEGRSSMQTTKSSRRFSESVIFLEPGMVSPVTDDICVSQPSAPSPLTLLAE